MQILICILDNSSREVGQVEEVTLKHGEKADLTRRQNYKCYRKKCAGDKWGMWNEAL